MTRFLASGNGSSELLLPAVCLVRFHVSPQMRRIKVPVPTDGAEIRLLAGVSSSDVNRQVAAEPKVFAARLAGERLLARVDSHVHV